jgi:hypothetical protein
MRAHYAIAIVAIVLIGFGLKLIGAGDAGIVCEEGLPWLIKRLCIR